MRRSTHIMLVVLVVAVGSAVAEELGSGPGTVRPTASQSSPGAEAGARPLDITPLIACDPAVQRELRCTRDQKEAIRRLLDEVDRPLFALRDEAPAQASRAGRPLVEQVERGLAAVLKPAQQKRLAEIVWQYRGIAGLLHEDMVRELHLSERQLRQLNAVLQDSALKIARLKKQLSDRKLDDFDKSAQIVHRRERDLVLVVLDDTQKAKWSELQGRAFDTSRLQPLSARAPEFQDAGIWVNSGPLTMEGLRGRVVVVEFFTFSCGNCIRNYPAMKRWHEAFKGKDVTIVGVHTPEVPSDYDVPKLRGRMQDNGILFPILVDNGKRNWEAWANRVWPSVYLVDKQGRVRSWWYGELNWPGSRGEEIMRGRIESLLAEASGGVAAPAGPAQHP